VAYNANGGSGEITNQTVTYVQTVILSDGSGYARPGYTLTGWSRDSGTPNTKQFNLNTEYSGLVLSNESNFNCADTHGATMTMYAVWAPTQYSVTFDKQSGIGGDNNVDVTYGADMPYLEARPDRTGYAFAGYYDAVSGGTQYYTAAGTSARAWDKTVSTTLYAQWTPNTYAVTFDRQNGTGGSDNVTATFDAAMPPITVAAYVGHTFLGYYDETSGGTLYYDAAGASAVNWNKAGDATLYAQWQPNRQLDRSETYWFANSRENFGSDYYVSGNDTSDSAQKGDFGKLADYVRAAVVNPDNARTYVNTLQDMRIAPWEGSCFGMASTAILDKKGQIDMKAYCDPGARTLREIARPVDNDAVRSAINYYHISQCLAFLRTQHYKKENLFTWRVVLQRLVQYAQEGKLMLFCYTFREEKEKGHAIAIIGYEQGDSGSHNLIAYDNRYPDRDVIVNVDAGFNVCIVDGREDCVGIEFTSDMTQFDKIDIDGPNNDGVIVLGGGSLTQDTTRISILAQGITTVTNMAGQTLTYNAVTGATSGTMEVISTNFIVNSTSDGNPAPVTMVFEVPDSDGFALVSNSAGINVSVTNKDIYASASSAEADTVVVAKNEGVSVIGNGQIEYTASLSMNNGVADMVSIDGKANGGASLNYEGDSVIASGAANGAMLTVFSDTVNIEKIGFSTPASVVLVTGTGSGIAGDVDIRIDSNGDGVFDSSVLTPVNVANLIVRYNELRNTPNSNFTSESWAAFQVALSDAQSVLNNANATQGSVDGALAALNSAYAGLMQNPLQPDTTKYISLWGKQTKYVSNFWNWIMVIFLFGWIWMAF